MKLFKFIYLLSYFLYSIFISELNSQVELEGGYKYLIPILHESDNQINVKVDSLKFDGYFVIKINKEPDCRKYLIDSIFYQCDMFWVDNVDDECKYLYNIAWQDYNAYYMLDSIDLISDTSKFKMKLLDKTNSKNYRKFKSFYRRFFALENETIAEMPFLYKKISTSILNNSDVFFFQDKTNSDIGYYFFRCSFYAGILQYDSFYLIDQCCSCRNYRREYEDKRNYLLPISKALTFQPVTVEEMNKLGYQISNWQPIDLFIK